MEGKNRSSKETQNVLHADGCPCRGDSAVDSTLERSKSAASSDTCDAGFEENQDGKALNEKQPWKESFIQLGPLSGIFAALLALASLIAALGILAGSDQAAVTDWSTPPSTYLAIFTAIANLSMRYSAIQGVAIAWWHRAMRSNGTTLESLHYDWRSGFSLRGAITAGRHMGLLGLACIFSTFVVVDGPFLQRASTVVPVPWVDSTIPLNVSIAQELPRFFGGSLVAPAESLGTDAPWSYAWNKTVPTGNGGSASNMIYSQFGAQNITAELGILFENDEPLSEVVRGCWDTCSMKLRAPAFAPRACTSEKIPVNYRNIPYVKNNPLVEDRAGPLDQDLFIISIGIVLDVRESVNLVTAYPVYSEPGSCEGYLNLTACTFDSAIGEYTVHIAEDKATFLDLAHPKIVALANNSAVDPNTTNNGFRRSTLGSIVGMAWAQFDTVVASLREETGKLYDIYEGSANIQFQQYTFDGCVSYLDPTEKVLESINRLMVTAGAVIASQSESSQIQFESQMDPGLPIHLTQTGVREGYHNVYSTNYAYFVAAAIVEIVCIAFIAPTYWKWWKLGRSISLSPLEIAKAFRSPLLAEFNSNARAGQIAKAGHNTHLRYGVVSLDGRRQSSELAFACPDCIVSPSNGEVFAR